MEYGCHPPPRTDGSRGGAPGRMARIPPLAGRHLSKNGVGLLGWILERASRGVLVYGGIGRSVGSGPDGAAGVGSTRPESRAARLSRRFNRPGSGEPALRGGRCASRGGRPTIRGGSSAFRGGSAAPDLAYPPRGAEGSPHGAEGSPRGASRARRKAAKAALREDSQGPKGLQGLQGQKRTVSAHFVVVFVLGVLAVLWVLAPASSQRVSRKWRFRLGPHCRDAPCARQSLGREEGTCNRQNPKPFVV